MASNRKQPFGYKMEWGEIVIQEQEASVVRWIFQTYLTAVSYTHLDVYKRQPSWISAAFPLLKL